MTAETGAFTPTSTSHRPAPKPPKKRCDYTDESAHCANKVKRMQINRFTCVYCEKVFCERHFHTFEHNCPNDRKILKDRDLAKLLQDNTKRFVNGGSHNYDATAF